jgi:diguanylate cyclase (GGDEF)-like protein/PAS domain S-box-containing protein
MSQPQSNARPLRRRPLRVLFLEDNAADAELCLHQLHKAGLEVRAEVVATPGEFEQWVRAKTCDVILADYQLTGWTAMDAFELLQQIGKDIPFILVTAKLGEEFAVECLHKGVGDYILKDRLARLPIAVCRALEQKYLSEEHKNAESILRDSEAAFRTLADTIASAIFIHVGTECRYVNHAAEVITGYSREELLGMSSWDLVHPDSRAVVIEKGLARLAGDDSTARYEMKILTKQGEARWLDVTVGKIVYEGKPAGLTTAFDITERKAAEDRITHLVASDPLTGLANYRRLIDAFDIEAQRSRRTGRSFALLLLDLDELKKINDTYGYLVGSRALCRLGYVLRVQCRGIDTAARHGGDEFAMLLPETRADGARILIERIRERLANDGEQPPLSVSIGTAVYPDDGDTLEKLLKTAECALYMMKGRHSETHVAADLPAGPDPSQHRRPT